MSAPISPPPPPWWRWSGWPFAVKVAIVAAVVVVIAAAGAWHGNGWSDFPGWLEATATFAALVAAVVAARYAAGAFSLEALREERWVEQQRNSQADQVAAWYLENVNTVAGPPSPAVAVVNASPLPIFGVRVKLTGIPGLEGADSDESALRMRKVPETLGPTGQTPLRFILEGNQLRQANNARSRDRRPGVEISFADAQGTRWFRRPDGKLLRRADPWESELR